MRNKPLKRPLKAVLVHAAVEFPRTHDLQSLLLLLRNNRVSVPPEIEQASALTRVAIEARYPGDIEPITREEVALEIHMAEKVVAWARVQICEVQGPGERGVQLE